MIRVSKLWLLKGQESSEEKHISSIKQIGQNCPILTAERYYNQKKTDLKMKKWFLIIGMQSENSK